MNRITCTLSKAMGARALTSTRPIVTVNSTTQQCLLRTSALPSGICPRRSMASDGFSALARAELGGFGIIKASVLGLSKCGKTTQCLALHQRLGVPHITLDSAVSHATQTNSAVSTQIKSAVSSGQPLSTEMVVAVLKKRVSEHDCRTHGWVLDGIPRSASEARELQKAGIAPRSIVFIETSAAQLDSRTNDASDKLPCEVETTAAEISQTLDAYGRHRVKQVNGDADVEVVYQAVAKAVK